MEEKTENIANLPASKNRLDKAGITLSQPLYELTEEYLDLEQIFDEYRELHLKPLTNLTAKLQTFFKRGCRRLLHCSEIETQTANTKKIAPLEHKTYAAPRHWGTSNHR